MLTGHMTRSFPVDWMVCWGHTSRTIEIVRVPACVLQHALYPYSGHRENRGAFFLFPPKSIT